MTIGILYAAVTFIIGGVAGVAAGYYGGRIDLVISFLINLFLSVPQLPIMIVIGAFFGQSMFNIVMVVALFSWASVARITRAETMSLKERDYVIASKNLGAGSVLIAVKHILPNILGPVIVAASLGVASAILTESSLSFLGLGISIPHASWGSMLQGAQSYILDKPMMAVYPGLLILLTVLSFNILGDVLRSALEPKIVK